LRVFHLLLPCHRNGPRLQDSLPGNRRQAMNNLRKASGPGFTYRYAGMHTWQKLIARMSLSVRRMAGGAILALLALGGLYALAPINDAPPHPKFLISLLLAVAFEIGFVTLTISFNCWLNLKLTRQGPIARESLAAKSNPILPWPEQEMASTEQYA
jgi:hypothetical protein